jgi:hypothetical protein
MFAPNHAVSFELPSFTDHAAARVRHRRVGPRKLARVWRYGTCYAAGDGCVAFLHGRRAAQDESRDTGTRTLPLNIALVVSADGALVTAHRVGRIPWNWQPMS